MPPDSADEPRTDAEPAAESHEHEEGGPIKTFLEHLEDLRWVLIKSCSAVALGMLICLLGANYVVEILKWPLSRAKISHSGTNQVWTISFGTNHFGTFVLNDEQNAAWRLGTNRYAGLRMTMV